MPGEPKRVQPSRDRDRQGRDAGPRRLRQLLRPALHDRPRTAAARPARCRRPAPRRGRRSPARGRSGRLPLRAWRSTQAACTRPANGSLGQDQVDPHPEVLVEHPGAVVPVGEDALVRPALAHDVVQPERLELRERLALRLASRASGRRRRPDRTRPRRPARCSCRRSTTVSSGPAAPRRRAGRPARRACTLVVGVGLPPVRHIHRLNADPVASRGDRARLGCGKPGASASPVTTSSSRRARGSPPRSTRPRRVLRPRSRAPPAHRRATRRRRRRRASSPAGTPHPAAARRATAGTRGTRCFTEFTFQVAIRTLIKKCNRETRGLKRLRLALVELPVDDQAVPERVELCVLAERHLDPRRAPAHPLVDQRHHMVSRLDQLVFELDGLPGLEPAAPELADAVGPVVDPVEVEDHRVRGVPLDLRVEQVRAPVAVPPARKLSKPTRSRSTFPGLIPGCPRVDFIMPASTWI